MYPTRRAPLTLLLTSALALGGCLGKTPPSQFYLLEPLPATRAAQAEAAGKPLVALAPVHIPQYLDRPQIVRATGKNAYRLDELNRWAEALDANIARVLAQDLATLVPADVVPANTSNRAKQAQFRVAVHILEFHVDAQGLARLQAQWQVTRSDDTVLPRQTRCDSPASTSDYGAAVQGLNQCIDRLARDIAETLQRETRR